MLASESGDGRQSRAEQIICPIHETGLRQDYREARKAGGHKLASTNRSNSFCWIVSWTMYIRTSISRLPLFKINSNPNPLTLYWLFGCLVFVWFWSQLKQNASTPPSALPVKCLQGDSFKLGAKHSSNQIEGYLSQQGTCGQPTKQLSAWVSLKGRRS